MKRAKPKIEIEKWPLPLLVAWKKWYNQNDPTPRTNLWESAPDAILAHVFKAGWDAANKQ